MTEYGAKDLADGLRAVRKNTLIIVEEVPQDSYGFRAAPETRINTHSHPLANPGTLDWRQSDFVKTT
jgi:hypothetical protein